MCVNFDDEKKYIKNKWTAKEEKKNMITLSMIVKKNSKETRRKK